jgi:manganese/iron transport system ATP-binding protein
MHAADSSAKASVTPSITVEGVTVRYTNGVTAVTDASFALGPGTICALVGINGSGKSTLFKTLMGFLKPARGHVAIAGMEVRKALKRGLVSYVPQAEEVDWSFPVLVDDVVMMGRYGHMGFLRIAGAADREAVDQALARVNMLEFRRRQIGELSGGQRKRVFLARALAQGGRVILLDEPFTGVDVKTEDQIVALMRELRDEGRLMLVSTHNLGSIPDFCDQVVIINKTVLAAGPTESTFTQDNLQRAFGGALRHFRLEGSALHDDDDGRRVTVITDDERPLVLYGERNHEKPASGGKSSGNGEGTP